VQVDPIKPTLKAPGTERLKLKYEEPLSDFGFKFNLRRYTEVEGTMEAVCGRVKARRVFGKLAFLSLEDESGRGLHSSTFRLIVSTFVRYAGWFHCVSLKKTFRLS